MTNVQHAKYRHRLPQLDGGLFLTDGGLETTLIYHDGFDLPMFEAFTLVESERGRAALRAYYDRYVSMAASHGNGFILESPTWRANPDWGAKLGLDRDRTCRRQPRRHRHAAGDPCAQATGNVRRSSSAERLAREVTATIPARR